MGQIISLNFGLVHTPPHFDYDFDFDDLEDEIKDQLPENTAEVLQLFSEEDLHFLRWRICWQRMAREKQLPPESFLNMDKPVWMIRSGRGFGKAVDKRCRVPIPEGWQILGNLVVGDAVFDEQGKPCHILNIFDIIPEKSYRFHFSDGTYIDCCSEHQWVTWTHRDRKALRRNKNESHVAFPPDWPQWRAPRTIKLPHGQIIKRFSDTGPQVRTTQEIVDTFTYGNRGDLNHCIPVCSPLQLPDADLLIDPYTLGYWLGNGTRGSSQISCASTDADELIGYLRYPVSGRQDHVSESNCSMMNLLGLITDLKALGVEREKHIPAVYLRGSIKQRRDLLVGLLDSDGHCSKQSGHVEFCSMTLALAQGVVELARSLGQKSVLSTGRTMLSGKDYGTRYRVTWRPLFQCFRLQRKANAVRAFDGSQSLRNHHRMIVKYEEIDPIPMRCLTVDSPNSMFLVGEGMIPTHNTLTGANWIGEQAWIYPSFYAVVSPTHDDCRYTCLESSTLVKTGRGDIPVRDVMVGDTALTRKGFRRVSRAWKTRNDAELWELRTENDCVIHATMDHKIWTENRGFVSLCQLNERDILLSCSMGSSFTKDPMDITLVRGGDRKKDSIERCTKIPMALSLMGMMYIIKTITKKITHLKIWLPSLRDIIVRNIIKSHRSRYGKSYQRRIKGFIRHSLLYLNNATTVGGFLSIGIGQRSPGILGAFAPFSVVGGLPGSITPRREYVPTQSVGEISKQLQQTNGRFTVPVSVKKLGSRADVYDLTVEGEHEFFANGVLVKNCFEGPTGLLSIFPPQLIEDRNQALPSITLKNGSIIRGFAGDTPERLRGPQHSAVWVDEIASFKYPDDCWDNIMFGLRLGDTPRVCVTGTPKPTPFVRKLQKDKKTVDVVGATHENRENLTQYFFDSIAKYEGTRVGRQEIYGEVLDPEEEGFVKRSQWGVWPKNKPLPKFKFVVLSLDPAFTERNYDKRRQENDPTACSVWGIFNIPRQGKPPLPHVLLLDAWEDWLGFPNLLRRVKKEQAYTYGDSDEPLLRPKIVPKVQRARHQGRKPDIILIEEKASGISLRQQLAEENVLTHGYNPGNEDKLTRLHYVSPMFAAGRVWAVESDINTGQFKTWADPLISQVCSYVGPGSVERDDLLDTTTQALRLLMDKFFGPFTVVESVEARESARAREIAERRLKKKENPYSA